MFDEVTGYYNLTKLAHVTTYHNYCKEISVELNTISFQ